MSRCCTNKRGSWVGFRLLFAIFGLSFLQVSSFWVVPHHQQTTKEICLFRSHHKARQRPQLQVKRSSSNDDDEGENDGDAPKSSEIPQLPVPGSSSFHQNQKASVASSAATAKHEGDVTTTATKKSRTGFLSKKFQLQYTCNVCETRNCHMISRLAYTEGVVVATCKGCNSKHMIADNIGLGGSDALEGNTNIEEYFKTKGMEDNINRVNRDVFDLEKTLNLNTRSGSLVDDDGNPVLE